MAELIKIAVVGNGGIFELLEKYGEELLQTRFGHVDGTAELREAARRFTYDAIAHHAATSRCRTCRSWISTG